MGAKKAMFDKNWFKSDAPARIEKKTAHFEVKRVTSMDQIPELITPREAAEKLRMHIDTIKDLRLSKKLKFMRIGGRYRTTPEWIADYLLGEMKKRG